MWHVIFLLPLFEALRWDINNIFYASALGHDGDADDEDNNDDIKPISYSNHKICFVDGWVDGHSGWVNIIMSERHHDDDQSEAGLKTCLTSTDDDVVDVCLKICFFFFFAVFVFPLFKRQSHGALSGICYNGSKQHWNIRKTTATTPSWKKNLRRSFQHHMISIHYLRYNNAPKLKITATRQEVNEIKTKMLFDISIFFSSAACIAWQISGLKSCESIYWGFCVWQKKKNVIFFFGISVSNSLLRPWEMSLKENFEKEEDAIFFAWNVMWTLEKLMN